jgi:hypothetical protein
MANQVRIRRPIANSYNTELVLANVVSQKDGKMLVTLTEKVGNANKPFEVNAADTIPANTVGSMQRSGIVNKAYPTSAGSYFNKLY